MPDLEESTTEPAPAEAANEPTAVTAASAEGTSTGRRNTQRGSLKVQLLVNDQIAFESEDPTLWQDVLAVMTGHAPAMRGPGERNGQSGKGAKRQATREAEEEDQSDSDEDRDEDLRSDDERPGEEDDVDADAEVKAFARSLSISAAQCVTACSPSATSPHLHLDHDCWEDFKANTPTRGPGAISPSAAAGTLLALWFRHRKLGNVSVSHIKAVLKTIDVYDSQTARGLKNSPWLQLKGETVVLRATETRNAKEFAKHFCTRQWPAIKK